MVTVFGIFDNDWGMHQAVERLAAAGFDDILYDEPIVPECTGNVAPVFTPGSAPPVVVDSSGSPPKANLRTIVRAFQTHLAQYHLSDEMIEDCAMAFYRNSKFVLVRTGSRHAKQVIEILRECGASRVRRQVSFLDDSPGIKDHYSDDC
jgi:hypothetical protein